MSAAHTPGPWRQEANTTLVWGNCNPDDNSSYGMGYPVADAQLCRNWNYEHDDSEPTPERALANACLIAAAPDLLAALKCFVEDERFHVAVGGNPNVVERMIADARAAIAKAEGKAP